MPDLGLKQPRAKRKRVETPPVAPPSAMAPDGRDVDARRAEVMTELVRLAGRGLPKKLQAMAAGVTPRTLRNWLDDPREPYATFAIEWGKAWALRGADLVDAVALTRPEFLLTHVYRLRPPVTETKTEHTIGTASRDEIRAELARRGWTPPALPADTAVDAELDD